MFAVSSKCLFVIVLWNVSLFLGSFLFTSTNISGSFHTTTVPDKFNTWVRDVYYKISLLGFIPSLYISYKQAVSVGGNFLIGLRLANTGIVETEYSQGIWAYVVAFALVSFLIELFVAKGHFTRRVNIILIINILLGIATMSKSSFAFLFVSTLVVMSLVRKIQLRKIAISFLVLVGIMAVIQGLRAGDNKDDKMLLNTFYTYFLGGVPALDQIIQSDMHSKNAGQNSLALINNVKAKITGNKDLKKKEYDHDITEDGYLYVPAPTNVYTVIGLFWLDYGYAGVIIFSFLLGAMSGYFFKLYRYGVPWGGILYSYFCPVLLLQFFGEYIFTNMSYLIQLILLSLFAYKFKYVLKWRKSTSC